MAYSLFMLDDMRFAWKKKKNSKHNKLAKTLEDHVEVP